MHVFPEKSDDKKTIPANDRSRNDFLGYHY